MLFRIHRRKKRDVKFEFIHGMRVIGMFWVILAHVSSLLNVSLTMVISPVARYPKDAIDLGKTLIVQLMFGGALAVHMFFIIRYRKCR